MLITKCHFEQNRADGGNGGGAIGVESGSTISISGSYFSENAASPGGAIWVNSGNNVTSINSSIFSGNTAFTDGAVETYRGNIISINGSNFSSNTASVGGAMGTFCGSIFIHGSNFIPQHSNSYWWCNSIAVLTYVVYSTFSYHSLSVIVASNY